MTAKNHEILERLFQQGAIALTRRAIFDHPPPPIPSDLDFAKVEGMMLGLAIGDALGNASEGQLPSGRRGRYGETRDYLPNPHAEGRSSGRCTAGPDCQAAGSTTCWAARRTVMMVGFSNCWSRQR